MTEADRILLINPRPALRKPDAVEPLGILYLAATLEKEGMEVAIWDEAVSGNLQNNILENYTVVGITAKTPQYPEAKRILQTISEYNQQTGRMIYTAIGGSHATIYKDTILADGWDAVCSGEAELVIAEMVTQRRKGLILGKQPHNLDTLPFPARHLVYPNHQYIQDGTFEPSVSIMSIRGCPFVCIYCSKEVMGRAVRYRSVENVVAEIRSVIDAYGIRRVIFYDDILTLKEDRIMLLSEQLGKLDVSWTCNSRVDSIDLEILQSMQKGGCQKISFGVESPHPRVLQSIDKRITTEQIVQAFGMAKDAGVRTRAYFMFGLPEDGVDSASAIIKFLWDVQPDEAQLSFAVPFPGTELYRQVIGMGIPPPADLREFYYAGIGGAHTFVNRTKYLNESQFQDTVAILWSEFSKWTMTRRK